MSTRTAKSLSVTSTVQADTVSIDGASKRLKNWSTFSASRETCFRTFEITSLSGEVI